MVTPVGVLGLIMDLRIPKINKNTLTYPTRIAFPTFMELK